MHKSPYIATRSEHYATICWWWTGKILHDQDYQFEVREAVAAAVNRAESVFGVTNNLRFCCQWEGVELMGESIELVTVAAKDVASVLSKFKYVKPLDFLKA